MRPALIHRLDEGFDEFVIFFAAHPLMMPADIEGIAQAIFVIGPDIEKDGQGGGGVQASTCGVEREFADGNAHAAGALVAEAQNTLAVAHHDGFDVIEILVREDLGDALFQGQ